MMDILYNDFASRLDFLCQTRKLYSWLMNTGLNSSNINTIKNNQAPNAELLAILRIQENVNINWVLDGSGSPYGVYRAAFDEEAAERLTNLLTDEPNQWRIHLCLSHEQKVIVLTQPGSMLVKEKDIDYTNVEIISGNMGDKTTKIAIAHEAYQIEMIQADLKRLGNGWMSTKELLGWTAKQERLITEVPYPKVAEQINHYTPERATSKQQLHTLIDNLTEAQAQTLAELLNPGNNS